MNIGKVIELENGYSYHPPLAISCKPEGADVSFPKHICVTRSKGNETPTVQ